MFLLGGNKRGNKILKHTHFDIKRYKTKQKCTQTLQENKKLINQKFQTLGDYMTKIIRTLNITLNPGVQWVRNMPSQKQNF